MHDDFCHDNIIANLTDMARKISEYSKREKIELRVTHEQKELLRRQAISAGLSLSTWIMTVLSRNTKNRNLPDRNSNQ
ncbi:hypothetical protein CCP4SC76_5740010 [Gammaproteobacteria bacterium]